MVRKKQQCSEALDIVEGTIITVNPSQDFRDGIAYVCVNLRVRDREEGVTVIRNVPCVITSNKEIIRADSFLNFNGRGIVPSSLPTLIYKASLWPYPLLRKYLDKKVKLNPPEILRALVDIYEKYLDFSEAGTSLILALWTMGTYFYRVFEAYPYLYLHGSKGSGKTKSLLVAQNLSYNSLMCSDITKAALFRTVEASSATVMIDEAERLRGKGMDEDLAKLLNAGYKKGLYAVRVDLDTYKPQSFDVYSPKILAGIRGLDPVLEDRCIVLTMIKTLDARKGNRAVMERVENWGGLRHLLYCYALDFSIEVSFHYESIIEGMSSDSVIQGRKGELWFPLLSIARQIDGSGATAYYDRVVAFAEKSIKEADQEGLDEWSTALLLGLESRSKEFIKVDPKYTFWTTEIEHIRLAMKDFLVDDSREVSTSWIGQQLKRWKLGTKKRKKFGFVYTIGHDEIMDRIKRYMPYREEVD